jgi:serine/threonine protein kinase/tetratricopeptide (TPR) repeat protein
MKIDGKYQVIKSLGEGFGGSVFLVEKDDQWVALKQLRMRTDHQCLSPEEILDNFKQEFSTLKNLNHPHILRILDFGFDPKENFYYFTTEYIEGKNIYEATRDLIPEEIEELFVQAFRALSYLHSHQVYHFDIKPTNILITQNPEGKKITKIIDFGLAAFQKKGFLAGTPSYLAPEALLGEGLDGRADLYSLGVTWYTCLAGQNPFQMEDMKKTIDLQRVWMPPPISTQSPKIPAYLDPIFEKLLKKNPAERYHRADQVIRDLNWSGSRRYPLETEATALAYLPGEGQLIGREIEWSQLLSFFDRVFFTKSESKICVLLSGDAGTGKSRLLKELKYHAQLQTIPVFNLREVSPGDLKSESLFVADDADSETVELAKRWMQQFHTHSFLILLAGRDLSNPGGFGFKIELGNLNRRKVSEYTQSVLGIENPPDFLVDELFSRTEGNPLLLTELLQTLIESHQIFDEQGRWSSSLLKEVGIDFNKFEVPKTLAEYCRTKFFSLPQNCQKILSALALAKASLDISLPGKLGFQFEKKDWELLEKEKIVRVDPASGELKLQNPAFRDCISQHLDSLTFASLHQALGDIFREDPRTQEAAWYHLGFGLGNPEERFRYLIQYGDALLSHNLGLEAAKAFGQASEVTQTLENRVDANLRRVRALFRGGHHSEALKLSEETQILLKEERKNPQAWRWVQKTFREMGSIYLKAGRLDLAHESLKVSRVLLEEHEEENLVEQMVLDNFRASLLMREGKLAEAQVICEETHSRWRTLPIEMKKQILNNELASIYLAQGKKDKAKLLFQEQAHFYEEIGHSAKRAYALYGWAESSYALKEFEEAIPIYQACLNLSREIKNEELLFHSFNGLGNITFLQKDWASAAQHYQEALELAEHNANLDSSVAIAINLAIVLRLQRDYGSAHLYLKHVIETLESQFPPSLHQLQFLTQGYLELGELNLEMGTWVESRDAYRDAVRLVKHHPGLERFRFQALSGLVRADQHLERNQEVQSVLQDLEKGTLLASEKEQLEKIKKDFEHPKEAGFFEKIGAAIHH